MSKYIDISVPVSPNLPRWPGSPAIEFQRSLDLERGDIANDTTIRLSVHTGTHVDAPLHFVKEGSSVEQMPLDILMGTALVADVSEVEAITPDTLEALALPKGTQRLLLRTRNSQMWQTGSSEFNPDFVAITADAAQWIVDRGIRLPPGRRRRPRDHQLGGSERPGRVCRDR